MSRKSVFFYNILILFFLYLVIALFFSIVYIALDFMELGSIIDHYSSTFHNEQQIDVFTRSLYFSFITLFAVGYGDMTPFGLSKGVAILQASIGSILPYALILNYIIFKPKFIRYIQKKL